jgi:hypothetical protein
MKKIYVVLFALLVFVACKKNELPGDNGCISRITRHYVTGADSSAAAKLFQQNNIAYNNLSFQTIILNDTARNVGGTDIYQHIFSIQHINGLPVLSDVIEYTFKNGVYFSLTGTSYNSINLSSHPFLSLPQLRKLYLNERAKNGYTADSFRDTCLVAEFGYYNLNAGTNNPATNFVKAWTVMPKNSYYPFATIRDDNAQTINYSSGIVFF